MKTMHLTEEMLQLVAIEGIEKHPSAKEHLKHCTACAAQVRLFSQMAETLETIPPDTFQFDLTSIVMEQLPESITIRHPEKKSARSKIIVALIFLGSLLIFYLFKDELLEFSKISNEITLFLITVSGLFLLSFLILDMLREYNTKIEKLNHL